MKIGNWGNYPVIEAEMRSAASDEEAKAFLESHDVLIPRGMGRSYGDSALQKNILSTLRLNRFLDYDNEQGIVTCEAGVTFEEVLRYFVPKGWFLPVTPGTKFITVGGAIASDIHGKNHHVYGTFSDHVHWFDLMLADGTVKRCSREENTDLFRLTYGGMGLTGVILRAQFRLYKIETSYFKQTSLKAQNLDEVMRFFEEYASYTYSVSWIDCLAKGSKMGRSILIVGENARVADLKTEAQKRNPLKVHDPGKLLVPFDFPSFALNSLSVKAFNFLYYNKQFRKKAESIVHYEPFYYPLDSIHHWNRIYGKRGFTQYQFVLPKETSYEGLKAIIGLIGKEKMGSFLTVLKLFGHQPENYLRFPREGYTLAMDFPISKSIFPFLDRMDELVLKYGGRVYLTKDVRMNAEFMEKTYPEYHRFVEELRRINPGKLASLQSERTIRDV